MSDLQMANVSSILIAEITSDNFKISAHILRKGHMMTDMNLRLVREEDAVNLAQALQRSRDHLAPWEPRREPDYFTEAGQRTFTAKALFQYSQGNSWPGVIYSNSELAGRITLNNILRGPLQSTFVSYWVSVDFIRKGIATEAVQRILEIAFNELSLHRVEAFTQIGNSASQLVLKRNNFTEVGVLHRHIYIGDQWRDELLFEHIRPAE